MKSLREMIMQAATDVYLSEASKRFIGSFGSPGKPVSLGEFMGFWDSLSDAEKDDIRLAYVPSEHPSMEGFVE